MQNLHGLSFGEKRNRIHHYIVTNGRGYWRPSKSLRSLGFKNIACGADGIDAREVAQRWNAKVVALRRGAPPVWLGITAPSKETLERARQYPDCSIGRAFQLYLKTDEWFSLSESYREKIWWPCYSRIQARWGRRDPNSISFFELSAWRSELEEKHGIWVAHATLKIWRRIWIIIKAARITREEDPSIAIRNRAPKPRFQFWTEGEAVRLVKQAWRQGHRGLACIIAIAWDSSFSPVDVRTLRGRHCKLVDGFLIFDKSVDGRQKTGIATIGTISSRTQKLVLQYLSDRTLQSHEFLFARISGTPFRQDNLSADFAKVRESKFPGDKRRLMDMRRSGALEVVAGGGQPSQLSAKLANSIGSSNFLHKTYVPINLAAVRGADCARLKGRKLLRSAEQTEYISLNQVNSPSPIFKNTTG